MVQNTNCCEVFSSLQENKDKKGFSIFKQDKPFFFNFWSVNKSDEEEVVNAFRNQLIGMQLPSIALQGNVVIRYCPFCGEKLGD